MAFLEFKNVRIAGIAAGVPKNVASNLHPTDDDMVSSEYSPEDYVKTTGVEERRVSRVLYFRAIINLMCLLIWVIMLQNN